MLNIYIKKYTRENKKKVASFFSLAVAFCTASLMTTALVSYRESTLSGSGVISWSLLTLSDLSPG